MTLRVARIGEVPAGEARRVLVDRLWPRGVRRDAGLWDEWLPDVAPSPELRRWYGHEPSRREEFAARYREELRARVELPALRSLLETCRAGPTALLTATRDVEQSQVPVLAEFLRERLGVGGSG